jgi:catechol 2,3-dioxygenase-like lactoylglutathione lyase family enzyme
MAPTTTAARITELGRVIVPVSDQERALEFYSGTLGFEKGMDVPMGDGYRWLEVKPPSGTASIAIVPPPEDVPVEGVDTGISFTTQDIDGLHGDLRERGVDTDDEVMRMGDPVPPMFSFRDPDGNTLRVVELT